MRIGARATGHDMNNAGLLNFMETFYSFNHPIYQVCYQDFVNWAEFPENVHKLSKEKRTLKSSNNELNHQGGDFILENKITCKKKKVSLK